MTRLLAQHRKALVSLDSKSLLRAISLHSDIQSQGLTPTVLIDNAFEELMTDILTKMKGT